MPKILNNTRFLEFDVRIPLKLSLPSEMIRQEISAKLNRAGYEEVQHHYRQPDLMPVSNDLIEKAEEEGFILEFFGSQAYLKKLRLILVVPAIAGQVDVDELIRLISDEHLCSISVVDRTNIDHSEDGTVE